MSIQSILCRGGRLYLQVANVLETKVISLVLFLMRGWIANVFFKAGCTKLSDWNSTLFLFQYEYKVPLIPFEFAAYSATFFELVCPILLIAGLMTRFATLPLLVMTAVIQFTYLQHTDHAYWALLLSTLLCLGAGHISIDYLASKKLKPAS